MLAKLTRELPLEPEGGWLYEPKWDGFRCIVFRDHDEVELWSRNGRSLVRYFPEIVAPLRDSLPERAVVDGELVIATPRGLDFDLLSLRIHPAASRVSTLAEATPASFVSFDLLAAGGDDLRGIPFGKRRARLVEELEHAAAPVHVTPATTDARVAADWFDRFEGAGLDGVVAKAVGDPYREGERAMLKVKHQRTADCVVAGYRLHKGSGVGSLLLGLYDDASMLHHVGVASSFAERLRRRLEQEVAPYEADALVHHPWRDWAGEDATGAQSAGAQSAGARMPGAPSRWNANKDLSWVALRPELVAEVAYEHLQGDRFRHTARFVRWRGDREPRSCTYAQLEVPAPVELHTVFGL